MATDRSEMDVADALIGCMARLPEFGARVTALMPTVLKELVPSLLTEIMAVDFRASAILTCRWVFRVAPYAKNSGNIESLVEIFQFARVRIREEDRQFLLRCLAEYSDDRRLVQPILLEGLSDPWSAPVCMRALCVHVPLSVAKRFGDFLALSNPDLGEISAIIKGVPLAEREGFLAIAGRHARVQSALMRHPLTSDDL